MSPLALTFAAALFATPGGWRDVLKRPGPAPAASTASATPPPALQESWDVSHYDISIDLDPDAQLITGDITITVESRIDDPGPLLLHARQPTISLVEVESEAASWTQSGDEVQVEMPAGLAAGDTASVRVAYTAPGTEQSSELGLHWGSPIYSFTEPEGSRNWLVVYDVPTDKATLAWHITAPAELVVVANGEPAGSEGTGEGDITWHFDFPWPIPPYLMVVDAGDFAVYEDDSGEVPVFTWAAPGELEQAVLTLGPTPEMIELFSELWTPYPYSLYGNVLVPMGGAMEHTTKTSFGEGLIEYGEYAQIVNAHELGHQWWGDYVTCAEWEEIWLNEGFASYSEALWVEHVYGQDGLQYYIWEQQREGYLQWKEIEGEFSLYDPDYMWGGTVYDKGSLVLHMLRFVMGDEAFFSGLGEYADRHAHDVATSEDLRSAMESTYGEDLSWFFDQWVYQGGDPSYVVGLTSTDLGEDGWQVDVHVSQTAEGSWDMPVEWVLELEDGSSFEDLQWVVGEQTVVSYCLEAAGSGLDFSPHAHLLYDIVLVDHDAFSPAERSCGEVPDDTGDTGPRPEDSGETGLDPQDSGEGSGEPKGRCGCITRAWPRWSLLLLIFGWLPWLVARRCP